MLGVVTMEVGSRLISGLRPQNPMGAGDQIPTLPLPHPQSGGTVLGKCIIIKIRIVAFRKTHGIVLERSSP